MQGSPTPDVQRLLSRLQEAAQQHSDMVQQKQQKQQESQQQLHPPVHETPTKSAGGLQPLQPVTSQLSPMPTPPSQPETDPAPALALLQRRWAMVSAGLTAQQQASADVLQKQAALGTYVAELVDQLLRQLQLKEEEARNLERTLERDRQEFTKAAKQLTQHFNAAQTKTTALQVVHEALQSEVKHVREQLEATQQENAMLKEALTEAQAAAQYEVEQQAQLHAALEGQGAACQELQLQLEEQKASVRELRQAKGALQTQLKGMVAAEQELTDHLKTTHQQIEEQLSALKAQLKGERQKRVQASRAKAALTSQVVALTQQLEALQMRSDTSASGGDQVAVSSMSAPGIPSHSTIRAAAKRTIKLGALKSASASARPASASAATAHALATAYVAKKTMPSPTSVKFSLRSHRSSTSPSNSVVSGVSAPPSQKTTPVQAAAVQVPVKAADSEAGAVAASQQHYTHLTSMASPDASAVSGGSDMSITSKRKGGSAWVP